MSADVLWAPVAGKYGRTRDGRRVGPMRNASEGGFYCQETGWYQKDGEWVGGVEGCVFDLVSEWIDDPAPAPPVDFSEIRAGDEIEVRLKVESLNRDGHALVRQTPTVYQVYRPEDILRHIPAPRPDEIGCRVRVVAQANEPYTAAIGETGTVKFIEGGFATLLRDAGAYGLARIDDLVRIDGEVA